MIAIFLDYSCVQAVELSVRSLDLDFSYTYPISSRLDGVKWASKTNLSILVRSDEIENCGHGNGLSYLIGNQNCIQAMEVNVTNME